MPDGSRFEHKKSFIHLIADLLSLIIDVATTLLLVVPLIFRALYRLVYQKRKKIGGKLALVRFDLISLNFKAYKSSWFKHKLKSYTL